MYLFEVGGGLLVSALVDLVLLLLHVLEGLLVLRKDLLAVVKALLEIKRRENQKGETW